MTAPKKLTTNPSLAARLVVTKGVKWPLLVAILPRVRAQTQPPPCGFCRETTVRTHYGWACPACETEMRTR